MSITATVATTGKPYTATVATGGIVTITRDSVVVGEGRLTKNGIEHYTPTDLAVLSPAALPHLRLLLDDLTVLLWAALTEAVEYYDKGKARWDARAKYSDSTIASYTWAG